MMTMMMMMMMMTTTTTRQLVNLWIAGQAKRRSGGCRGHQSRSSSPVRHRPRSYPRSFIQAVGTWNRLRGWTQCQSHHPSHASNPKSQLQSVNVYIYIYICVCVNLQYHKLQLRFKISTLVILSVRFMRFSQVQAAQFIEGSCQSVSGICIPVACGQNVPRVVFSKK